MQRKSLCRKMANISYSRSQMEQVSCQDEIRFSEIIPNEAEGTKMICEENRTGLNHKTQ